MFMIRREYLVISSLLVIAVAITGLIYQTQDQEKKLIPTFPFFLVSRLLH